MDINTILLVCAALFPAAALCVYIFKKDRVEKEPIGLLVGLLFLGVIICYPAAIIEGILDEIITAIFMPFTFEADGYQYLGDGMYRVYNAVKYFIGVALVEEGLKFAVLALATRKNKNFNSLFDGIIYSVFVSLGFAAFENVLYVLDFGWETAVMRAVMSVPGHMFFAVMMGYYYSIWHMKIKARDIERKLKSAGALVSPKAEFSPTQDIVFCLLVPVLFHGLYDYCCTMGTAIETVIFYGFLIFMYIYCFRKIRKMSKADMDDNRFAGAMVVMKYPELTIAYEAERRRKEEQNTINL